MNDFKLIISRSFERTIQVVQFEPAKFWAAYSLEVSSNIMPAEIVNISETLFDRAKLDVEKSMADYKEEKEKIRTRIAEGFTKAEAVKRIENGGWPKDENFADHLESIKRD